MLKRIISDIDVKEFIGLILLFSGLVIYTIYYPGTVAHDDAKQIRITLNEVPNYDTDAETGYDFFILSAQGINRKFIVKYWTLNQQIINAINNIDSGSDLIIAIEKSEMKGEYIRRKKSDIHVLALKKPNSKWIYSLSDYNQGKTERWKEFLFYGILFGVLMLPLLFGKLRRLIRNEPEVVTDLKTNEDND